MTVLAHAGKPGPAGALGHELLHRSTTWGASPARRVGSAARPRAGRARRRRHGVRRGRRGARPAAGDLEPGAGAALDAVGAHVALAGGRLDEARRLASAAVARADRPEVECEALEVLGRLASASESVRLFRRSADVAERHGLTTWRLRALQELALTEATFDGSRRSASSARWRADAGAHLTVAQMDLVLADMALGAFDRDACRQAAERCADASRRYGLASLPVALLWLAGAHALDGRGGEMEAVLAEADAAAPGDPRVQADAWGRVRATHHALREDREALRDALERSMEFTRVAPEMESVYPGQYWWAMLRAMSDDDLGLPARAEIAQSRIVAPGSATACLELVDAVVLGRQGRAAEAGAAVERARLSAHRPPPLVGYGLRLVAEAAVRDGSGEPAGWFRESEGSSRSTATTAWPASAGTSGAAGAPAARRGPGRPTVPPALRRLGITSRELDVLALVARGLPTREISNTQLSR